MEKVLKCRFLRLWLKNGNNAATNKVYHKIRDGETLLDSQKYRTTVSALKRLNGLKSDFIRAGRTTNPIIFSGRVFSLD